MIKLPKFPEVKKELLDSLALVAEDKRAAEWERQTNNVKAFKKIIKEEGLVIQDNRCAWCTLMLGRRGRRTAHRDHIAPKKQYPKWTFFPKNIIMSCEYCNGFTIKCDLDTVKELKDVYEDCEFYIVHPYIDEVELHIGFSYDHPTHGVVINGLSEKGLWTIEKMKLDDGYLTILRAQDYAYCKMIDSLPDYYATLLLDATHKNLK